MRRDTAQRVAALGLLVSLGAQAAVDPAQGDVRDLTVGMRVDALPTTGYVRFACGNDGGKPGASLNGWSNYNQCPANEADLYEVTFQYDDSLQPWAKVNDKWEGTKVAGHPVRLSLLFDSQGLVQGLRVLTDPEVRKYMRKKAYLLSFKVKSRYGQEGWDCVRHSPEHGETPVGGIYIKERCEKASNNKRYVLETRLFRRADQGLDDFTNSTRFEVWLAES